MMNEPERDMEMEEPEREMEMEEPEREMDYSTRNLEPVDQSETVRTIEIRPLNHGYLVRVGCQQMAIESPDKLLGALGKYLKSPGETEREYRDGKLL